MAEKAWTDTDTSKKNHCLVSWTANENGAHHFPKGAFCVICFLFKVQLRPFYAFQTKGFYIYINFKHIDTDRSILFTRIFF